MVYVELPSVANHWSAKIELVLCNRWWVHGVWLWYSYCWPSLWKTSVKFCIACSVVDHSVLLRKYSTASTALLLFYLSSELSAWLTSGLS